MMLLKFFEKKSDLAFWENIFSMSGAACLAVAFIDLNLFACSTAFVFVGIAYYFKKKKED